MTAGIQRQTAAILSVSRLEMRVYIPLKDIDQFRKISFRRFALREDQDVNLVDTFRAAKIMQLLNTVRGRDNLDERFDRTRHEGASQSRLGDRRTRKVYTRRKIFSPPRGSHHAVDAADPEKSTIIFTIEGEVFPNYLNLVFLAGMRMSEI